MGPAIVFQVMALVSPAVTLVALLMLLRFRRVTPEFPLILIGLAAQLATGVGHLGLSVARMLGFDVNSREFIELFYQGTSLVGMAGRICLLAGIVLVCRQLESRLSFLTEIVESQPHPENRE